MTWIMMSVCHMELLELGFRQMCVVANVSTTGRPQSVQEGLCTPFLQQNAVDSHKFLDCIVTGDETWVHHHTLHM